MAEKLAFRLIVLGLAAGVMAAPMAAGAATWKLLFDGDEADAGTFVADAGGGQVTAASILWDGILYDTPYDTTPPEYNPVGNPEFMPFGYVSGPLGGGVGWFWNSAATGGCAALSCTIGLSYNDAIGEYVTATGFMPTDSIDEQTGGGEYTVAPVPLPAGLLLILSGVAGIVWIGRGRRV